MGERLPGAIGQSELRCGIIPCRKGWQASQQVLIGVPCLRQRTPIGPIAMSSHGGRRDGVGNLLRSLLRSVRGAYAHSPPGSSTPSGDDGGRLALLGTNHARIHRVLVIPGRAGVRRGVSWLQGRRRRSRSLELCSQCPDFPCEHVETLAARYPTLIADNVRLKAVGLEQWLIEQKERVRRGVVYADTRYQNHDLENDTDEQT